MTPAGAPVVLRPHATPRLLVGGALAALGLAAAVAVGDPAPALVAVPFAVLLAIGLALPAPPPLVVTVGVDRPRCAEGDAVVLAVRLRAERAVRVDVAIAVPAGVALDDATMPASVSLVAGAERELRVPLRAERFGAYALGDLAVRIRDDLGLLSYESDVERDAPLRVYPRVESLRRLVRPLATRQHAGNLVSAGRGEGLELAELRPFVPGDAVRSINARATARRGEPIVNVRHPERHGDIVLLLDALAGAGGGGTLEGGVRAAATIAAPYLAHRDRVGLLAFGGRLRWLVPGGGLRQLERVIDTLLDTQLVPSQAWALLELVPPRTLPPGSLVLAVSPLADDRFVRALRDLRGRRHDVAAVEVSGLHALAPTPGRDGELALRILALRRAAMRDALRAEGIAVGEWRAGEPVENALEEITRFRRGAARLVAL